MDQIFRVGEKAVLSGESLEQLVRAAGFTDITSHIVKVEIGDWGSGLLPTMRANGRSYEI